MSPIHPPVLDLTCEEEQQKVLKALANPIRVAILQFLHNGPSCVSLPCIRLGIPQPVLSKHLAVLKEAGLVNCRTEGTKRCYFICRPSVMGPIFELFGKTHDYKPCSKPEQHE